MLLCSFVDFDEDLMQPALWVLDLIFDGIGASKKTSNLIVLHFDWPSFV